MSAVRPYRTPSEGPPRAFVVLFSALIALVLISNAKAQTLEESVPSPPRTDVDTTGRRWLLGGTIAAANTTAMVFYFSTYYKENSAHRSPWHSFNDWYNTDMNVDKLGHVYMSQTYSNGLYHLLTWAQVRETPAMIWSASIAFLFQLEMEITDGFYRNWGFSWWDIAANAVGSIYPHVQRRSAIAQAISLKASYHPSRILRERWSRNPIADYDGVTYWLSINPSRLLSRDGHSWWPRWLAVAVGYGAQNTMLGKGVYNSDEDNKGLGTQEWYVGVDLDFRHLRSNSHWIQMILDFLTTIRLPLPTVRVSPGTVWYGVYF